MGRTRPSGCCHLSLTLPSSRSSLRLREALDFTLPPHLEASEPPEARGLERDEVQLMVSYRSDDRIVHASFTDLPLHLDPGDLLVVNSSGTLNASIPALRANGQAVELHLSTHLPGNIWVVELRERGDRATRTIRSLAPPESLRLPAGGEATIHDHYYCGCFDEPSATRLWIATLRLPMPVLDYLSQHAVPIRYDYVKESWPNDFYQTIFATEPGSAEMPSAGRAFSPRVLRALGRRGVGLATLVLHTGVASLETHEPPYEEFFRVSFETARKVNEARDRGNR